MRAFFFFLNALCSAAQIFFSSSEPEATSSERYSSTAAQPASDLSAILMSLFLRFEAFEAALRGGSTLKLDDFRGFQGRRGQFPFRKRSLPFETVDAISQETVMRNGIDRFKWQRPF